MSKVKNIPAEISNPRGKEKIRGSLRRAETEQTKMKRMTYSKKFGCRYRYYVRDSRIIRKREQFDVPERTEPHYHWEVQEKEYSDKHGQIHLRKSYERVFDGYRIVPAHTVTRSRIIGEIPCKPYLKEYSDRKKWLKREAARRVRSAPQDCLYNHGDYKRLYDLWWTLW